jgi:hypothetical protein
MKAGEQLSPSALSDFKEIYGQEFGIVLSDEEVQEVAIRLLRFFDMLSKPILDDAKNRQSTSDPLV